MSCQRMSSIIHIHPSPTEKTSNDNSNSSLRHRSITMSQNPLSINDTEEQANGSMSTCLTSSLVLTQSKHANNGTEGSTSRNGGRRRHLFRKVRRHVRRRLGGKESALLVLYSLGLLISSCGNSIGFK